MIITAAAAFVADDHHQQSNYQFAESVLLNLPGLNSTSSFKLALLKHEPLHSHCLPCSTTIHTSFLTECTKRLLYTCCKVFHDQQGVLKVLMPIWQLIGPL